MIKKISLSLKLIIRTNNKPKITKLETKLKLSLRSRGVPVEVYDS
jgi:hypothetical protein